MSNQSVGPSQNDGSAPSSGMEGNPEPVANTAHSDLAASRAQRQATAPATAHQSDSGQGVPNTQEASQQRSEYIPRERFDEVNARRIAAEAQLQQLTQMSQGQMQRAAQANSGYGMPQQQALTGQQVAQSPQVQNFLASLSDKEEQEKWRQKIVNQPVTGIAELIQHAIQTEGSALLNQHIQQLQSYLAPLQSFYQQQQQQAVSNYAKQRATDPNWAAVEPVFNQLAQQAQQGGYQLTQQNLQVIEGVARTKVGIPMWGQPTSQPAPFTERPAGQGGFNQQSQQVQLTEEQKNAARLFGLDEATYARNLAGIRRANGL